MNELALVTITSWVASAGAAGAAGAGGCSCAGYRWPPAGLC